MKESEEIKCYSRQTDKRWRSSLALGSCFIWAESLPTKFRSTDRLRKNKTFLHLQLNYLEHQNTFNSRSKTRTTFLSNILLRRIILGQDLCVVVVRTVTTLIIISSRKVSHGIYGILVMTTQNCTYCSLRVWNEQLCKQF